MATAQGTHDGTTGRQGDVATGTGHGKAILVGEHHVMTGATALVASLPSFLTTIRLEVLDGDGLSLDWPGGAELPEEVRADTLRMVEKACALAGWNRPTRLRIESTIPMRGGLGSSAALAVAALRSAYQLANHPEQSLWQHATEVENIVHGRSSGLDTAAAMSMGDARLFCDSETNKVQTSVRIHASLVSARWVLLDAGAGVPTREAIATAYRNRESLGDEAVAVLAETTTDAANSAANALTSGDLPALAAALARAGAAMEPLGVVNDDMRRILSLALAAGALAAKQTGAGLGGMLLALAPDATTAARIAAAVAPFIHRHWQLPIHEEP